MPSLLPHWQLPEAGVHVAEPQAAAAPAALPNPVADAGQLPAVEATEEEALYAAVEEAQRMGAGDGAACAEATQEAADRRQQEDGERRRRSKMVQNIALCEKLGIKYRTKGDACPPAGRSG